MLRFFCALILFATFFSASASAQGLPTETVREVHEEAFSWLDLTETTTGILANRNAYLIDYSPYDGSTGVPALTGSAWEVTYLQLRHAVVGVSTLPTPEEIEAAAENHFAAGRVPLALVWHRYDYIDSTAFADDRLAVQQEHYIRPVAAESKGVAPQYVNPVSPYLTRTLFASAALTDDLGGRTRVGPTATFILDGDLVVVEPGRTLSQVEVDFDNGQGYRAVSVDAPITISYSSSGEKTATLRAQVDGSTYYSRFTLYAETDLARGGESPDVLSPWLTSSRTYCASGAGDGGGVNDEYNGCQAAQYQYAVYYGQGNTQLTKPILFLDGFDLNERRRVQDIYDEFLDPQGEPAPTLADILRGQGYDLVIVDWQRSQDFIQRNAYAATDVLEWVNSQLPPGNEIAAVIGSSMGGLVGRYALLYMEDQGLDHNTKLFVSYDSPQQGANIPIGFQWLIRDWKWYSPQADDFWKVITSPSARQMLFYNTQHEKSDPFRGALYDDFVAMGDGDEGYPSDDIRLVAVANGSGSGLLQFKAVGSSTARLQPGNKLLKQETKIFIIVGVKSIVDTWAAPERTLGQRLVYRRADKLCLPWPVGCNIPLGTENRRVVEANPYDSAPGGWRTSADAIESAEDTGWNGFFNVVQILTGGRIDIDIAETDVYAKRHAFVPTVSALDYNTTSLSRAQLIAERFGSQNLGQSINRSAGSRTPFADFYLPGDGSESHESQEHVSGNAAIAQFLLEQLGSPPPPPPPPSYSVSISGLWSVAVNTTNTWVAGASGGVPPYTYEWSTRYPCDPDPNPCTGMFCTMDVPICEAFDPAGTGLRLTTSFPTAGAVDIRLIVTDSSPEPAGSQRAAIRTITVTQNRPAGTSAEPEVSRELMGVAADAVFTSGTQPDVVSLEAFPNPFTSAASVRFGLPVASHVRLSVYDALGREVARLADGSAEAGWHLARFDASGLPSGLYLLRFVAGDHAEVKRITLLK